MGASLKGLPKGPTDGQICETRSEVFNIARSSDSSVRRGGWCVRWARRRVRVRHPLPGNILDSGVPGFRCEHWQHQSMGWVPCGSQSGGVFGERKVCGVFGCNFQSKAGSFVGLGGQQYWSRTVTQACVSGTNRYRTQTQFVYSYIDTQSAQWATAYPTNYSYEPTFSC